MIVDDIFFNIEILKDVMKQILNIDVENDVVEAYEFKWKEENVKIPVAFHKAYPRALYNTIHQKNYLDFIV